MSNKYSILDLLYMIKEDHFIWNTLEMALAPHLKNLQHEYSRHNLMLDSGFCTCGGKYEHVDTQENEDHYHCEQCDTWCTITWYGGYEVSREYEYTTQRPGQTTLLQDMDHYRSSSRAWARSARKWRKWAKEMESVFIVEGSASTRVKEIVGLHLPELLERIETYKQLMRDDPLQRFLESEGD